MKSSLSQTPSTKRTAIPTQAGHGPIEVSALYYPGTEWMRNGTWSSKPAARQCFSMVRRRKLEVIDWQIKWAVSTESSFCVDWYWNNAQRLDHWVKGFYKARFRNYLKWYIMGKP